MAEIAVRPLIEFAAAVPRIAAWFYEEWGAIYGAETQASVRQRIQTWLTRGKIPTALVAVADHQVIGTIALKQTELQFPYSPWLAGLFVIPQFRRRGIGALLVGTAENEAASLGFERLHLYTPASAGFYERLGWLVTERCHLPSGSVAVMSKRLQPHDADDMKGRLTWNQ